jgi:hypothetical protein
LLHTAWTRPVDGKSKKGFWMQQKSSDPRIARMFRQDAWWSVISLGVLWLLYTFVFLAVYPMIHTPMVVWLLIAGAALVLAFNAASIFVMVRHLSEDRKEIYGLDLHYLDAATKK